MQRLDDNFLFQKISELDNKNLNEKKEHLKTLIMNDADLEHGVHAGILVNRYYGEAMHSYYSGNLVATIVMVQLTFEELLREKYRIKHGCGSEAKLMPGIKIEDATFSQLINKARKDDFLNDDEAMKLDNFRKNIRNPYVHPKNINFVLAKKDSYTFLSGKIPVFVKGKKILIRKENLETEAKDAIVLLLKFAKPLAKRMAE